MGIKSTGIKIKIYEFTHKVIDTIFSILSILTSSVIASYKIRTISKTQTNSCCCVLGNAPSLQDSIDRDTEFIKQKDVLAVNFFAEYDCFLDIKPNYYLLIDPEFFNSKTANNFKVLKLIERFNCVSWKMILFLPAQFNNFTLKNKILNKNINIVKFNANRVNGFNIVNNLLYKLNLGTPSSRNVIIPSILLMINFNYKNIYLFGVEYSWISKIRVNEHNRFFWNDDHAFQKKNIRYLAKGEYKEWLKAVYSMLDAHERLENFSKLKKCRIINKTKGSYVDAHKNE